MRVSHETIYTSLFVQSKAVLRTELTGQLRTRRVRRRPHRWISAGGQRRSRIPNLRPISERPDTVIDRTEPGHWEGDLIVGRHGRSHLITLVERHSRFLIVVPITTASSAAVITGLCRTFTALPEPMARSLTWDRGIEMSRHAGFSSTTRVPVFFCNAYSPWQRGSNENTNGLLRQYFPKKTDLSVHTPEACNGGRRTQRLASRRAQVAGPAEVYRAANVALIA